METIREDSLHTSISFVTFLGFILLLTCIWSLQAGYQQGSYVYSSIPWSVWIACGILLCGTFISQKISKRSTKLASWIICSTLSCAIVLILFISSSLPFQQPFCILALLLPIFLASFLFPWKQLLIWIGFNLICGFVINYHSGYFHSFLLDGLVPICILMCISGLFFLITFNIFSSFQWYQQHYQSILVQENIIKENQTELRLLVKRMETYQRYLNKSNDLLSQAYEEAKKARRVKQEFVQNISHELRTPLNIIIGFSETMHNTPEIYHNVNWTPELVGDIDCIYQNSRHLKGLIDDVLDLAAIENNSMKILPIACNLNEILVLGVRLMKDSFITKGLTLELEVPSEPILVYADTVRIQQVVLNLLSNAYKNTLQGGVKITIDLIESAVRVCILDTGIGIPVDELEKVFTPFYRASNVVELNQNGTGLGLSISKHYIELHGGKIFLENMHRHGTKVTFTLPVLQ